MNFFETKELYKFFPGTTAVLDEISIDGNKLTGWDASKIVNTNADGNGIHHRLELYNAYGETRDACALRRTQRGLHARSRLQLED